MDARRAPRPRTLRAAEFIAERLASPLGELLLVSDGEQLRALDFADCRARMDALLNRHYGAVILREGQDCSGARRPLEAYFGGELTALDALPVDTNGTDFQRRVWRALRAIPPGSTRNYGQLAAELGLPRGARAVGHANGANPISIVIPCHRLVGADGALTGYAGGVERKRWLLRHEGVLQR
ncbi:MAG: methylated-DNA--[protein]-cysteine S-methyltransferase [Gammaproteobacteria bacterium]